MIEQLLQNVWITHTLVFLLGVLSDRFLLQKLGSRTRIKIDPVAIIRLMVLLAMLLLYFSSLVSFQFYGGHEPSLIFSLLGAFAFGSLVGEKNLILTIIEAVKNNKK